MLDLLIRNGHVIDPGENVDRVCDIGVYNGRIVAVETGAEAQQTVDAAGCYVLPGLIDFHTHIFEDGSTICMGPALLPGMGVTAACDAGSSGCANFTVFYRDIIAPSKVPIKVFLNCYTGGLPDYLVVEDFNPERFDQERIARLKAQYPDTIIGLKVRLSKNQDLTKDIMPLKRAVELAEEIGGLRVCVHVTNPPCSMEEVADTLRPGDILCHMYHGQGDTILDADGHVKPGILAARRRGVLFDLANGKKNYSNEVCLRAMKEGFLPDIISTDLTKDKAFYDFRVRSLPYVMSKMLSFGMDLKELVRAVTQTPAALMGMAGTLGTLRPGAYANISILRLTDRQTVHEDFFEVRKVCEKLFVPQMTVVGGVISYAAIDFNLPPVGIDG